MTKFVAFLLTRSARCWPRRSTRWPTRATSCCCCVGGRRARRAGHARAPLRLRPRALHLRFIVSIVLFSVGGLFALYEAYHKVAATRTGIDSTLVVGADRGAARRRSPGGLLVPHRRSASRDRPGGTRRGSRSSATRRRPSCRSSCSRTRGPDRPGVRPARRRADGDHRQPCGTSSAPALIGLLLVAVAIVLGIETKSLLLGRGGRVETCGRSSAALAGPPASTASSTCKTLHLGPEELLVAAKIAVPPPTRADRVARAIDRRGAGREQAVPRPHPADVPRARPRPRGPGPAPRPAWDPETPPAQVPPPEPAPS